MITFDDARAVLTKSTGVPSEQWGWENRDVYLVVPEYGDFPPFEAPDYLVDKRTGKLTEVYGLLGKDPVPGLRPIGNPPE